MSGFQEGVKPIYVSIIDGMFAIRAVEGDPKAKERTRKDGSKVWERYYKSYAGWLKEVSFRDAEFGGKKWEELVIRMFDGRDTVAISMPSNDGYAQSFLRTLPGVNLAEQVRLTPYTKTKDDKTRKTLYINQPVDGRESLQWCYSKENPNGLPDLVEYKIPGESKVRYSDVKRMEFLKEMVAKQNSVLSKLSHTPMITGTDIPDEEPDHIGPADDGIDPLPF